MRKIILAFAGLLLPALILADEGMWTIDNFPADDVADKYDVNINDRWLRDAQLVARIAVKDGAGLGRQWNVGLVGVVDELERYVVLRYPG